MKRTIIIVNDIATIGGGASKIAVKSAIELAKDDNYEIIFFGANKEIDKELKNNKNIRTICISTKHIAQNKKKIDVLKYGIWNLHAENIFEKLLSQYDPTNSIVHVHSWSKALSVSVVAIAYKNKFSIVITLHDYFSVCPNGGFYNYRTQQLCELKPLSVRCYLCNCDKRSYLQKIWRCIRQTKQNKYISDNELINYIYISNRIYSLSKPYIKSNSFYFLQNPIDLAEDMIGDHVNSHIIICVGRVSEEKGVEYFCEAITEVQKKNDIIGIVIGEGPLFDFLRTKYRNIEFTGWVDGEKMSKYYKEARALIFPSICNEGSPLTIPEALSYGLPCIVTNCTSAVEMIEDNVTGLVYESKNTRDLISKINIILDDEVITRMQKNISRSFDTDEYSYETHVSSLKSIYSDIMDKRELK